MPRLIGPIIAFILRNVLSGALWAIGSVVVDEIHKKGIPMLRTPKLLFHPKVTFGAFLAGLASLLTFAPEIKSAFGTKGLVFVIASTVLYAICAYGRSPASAVDNNQVPK